MQSHDGSLVFPSIPESPISSRSLTSLPWKHTSTTYPYASPSVFTSCLCAMQQVPLANTLTHDKTYRAFTIFTTSANT